MRGIELLLLAGFIGLIGVGAWNARQWLPQWGDKSISSAAAAAGANKISGGLAGKSDSKGRVGGKRGIGRSARASITADVRDGNVSISTIYVQVPVDSGFPTAADLPVGAHGAEIVTKYGEPTARVTEMRTGHLFEHYYYFNNDRTQLTVATLESGIIVSAENIAR
jgi:hypothetical protein